MMSRASRSVLPVNSSVSGAPATLLPLTICVPPRRAHSDRTRRAGAFWATRFTRPPRNSIFTVWAAAEPAPANTRATQNVRLLKLIGYPISIRVKSPLSLMLADVFDDGADNRVQRQGWLVTDEFPQLGYVRHPPGHVFKPLFIRLVVRHELNRRSASRHFL